MLVILYMCGSDLGPRPFGTLCYLMIAHAFMCVHNAGYTIFVVEGDLPPCEADQLLMLVLIQADQRSITKKKPPESGGLVQNPLLAPRERERRRPSTGDEDVFTLELATALSASMTTHTGIKGQEDEFDITMAAALLQGELLCTCYWHNNIIHHLCRRQNNS